YEEVIGRETATWGIVHRDPRWLDPGAASCELTEDMWRVVCADVHQSYDYWLDSNGEFVSLGGGGRCESFCVKIERSAMFWEATYQGRSWDLDLDVLHVAGSVGELVRLVHAKAVAEASDKYATCWRAVDVIVVDGEAGATVWVAADAHENL